VTPSAGPADRADPDESAAGAPPHPSPDPVAEPPPEPVAQAVADVTAVPRDESSDAAPDAAPEAASGTAADGGDGGPDLDGPRRRARRERAERRVVQTRARAIEEARREAKRRASNPVDTARTTSRGAVRGLKPVIVTILVTVLAGGLGAVLYFTPLMSAREVAVTGAGEVPQQEVLDAAQVRLGTPLLQINTDEVADRVATIRRVASARVRREYPSTLWIDIFERVAVAVKDFPDGTHLYDRDGVDFATGPPPPALPFLDVDNPGPTDPPTRAALEVLTALRPEVAGQVGRVAAQSVASITLTFTDGRVVMWGTNDRTEEKAEKLGALLTQPGRTYDVSSPDLPTVK
jgi:cell division protein FtsQ